MESVALTGPSEAADTGLAECSARRSTGKIDGQNANLKTIFGDGLEDVVCNQGWPRSAAKFLQTAIMCLKKTGPKKKKKT